MTEQADSIRFKRTILDDKPAESDAFTGRGHKRTANALADTITAFDNYDRAIGLEGKWGSGKSTIINIAAQLLRGKSEGKKYHFFTFDLWANQTTHFRRAFLESFLNWAGINFSEQEIQEFVEEKKKEIGDKTRTIVSKGYKPFNWFGIVLLLFIPFLPLIYMWLNANMVSRSVQKFVCLFASTECVKNIQEWSLWNLTFPIIALLAIGMMIYLTFKRYNELASDGKPDALSRLLSLFSRDVKTHNITQSIRDEDPTQYEFSSTFREIVKILQRDNERIVFVFDNVDRLPNSMIPDTWAEVRAVITERGNDSEKIASISAIVPYDRSILLNSISTPKSNEETVTSNNTGNFNPFNKTYEGEDLFRKSFDAILFVAPPILTDAENYFYCRYEEAFGAFGNQKTAHRIYKIFDRNIQLQTSLPTPRQVIAYINTVAALWQQWDTTIPQEAIAAFVVHQDHILENPDSLRFENSIDRSILNYAAIDEIYKYLAALAYNVDPKYAQQVASYGAIQSAIIAENVEDLQKLADAWQINGFNALIDKVIQDNAQDWAQNSPLEFANVVDNLGKLKTQNLEHRSCQITMTDFVSSLKSVAVTQLSQFDKLLGVIDFVHNPLLPEMVAKLLDWINRELPKVEERNTESGTAWISFVGKLCHRIEAVRGKDWAEKIKKSIVLPDGSEFILGMAEGCEGAAVHLREFSGPNIRKEIHELQNLLATLSKERQDDFLTIWGEFKHALSSGQNEFILEEISQFLQATDLGGDAKKVAEFLYNFHAIYATLGAKSKRDEITDALLQNGAVFHQVFKLKDQASREKDDAVANAFALVVMRFGNRDIPAPNPQPHPTFQNTKPAYDWFVVEYRSKEISENVTSLVVELLIAAGQLSATLGYACDEPPERGLLKSVARGLISRPHTYSPWLSVIIDKFVVLRGILGDQLFDRLLSTAGNRSDRDYWKIKNFEDIPPEMIGAVADRKEVGWSDFMSDFDNWIQGISADEWNSALSDGGPKFDLLRQRALSGGFIIPSGNHSIPLRQHILDVLIGATPVEGNYNLIVATLPGAIREELPRDVFKRLDVVAPAGIVCALTSYSDVMDALPISENPEKATKELLRPIIQSKNDLAAAYLRKRSSEFVHVLQQVDEAALSLISNEIETLEVNADEEIQSMAAEFRELLKLQKKQTPDVESKIEQQESKG